MNRWQVKLLCGFLATVVSVVCTLIPFKLPVLTCQKLRKKLAEKSKQKDGCQSIEPAVRTLNETRQANPSRSKDLFSFSSEAETHGELGFELREYGNNVPHENAPIRHDGDDYDDIGDLKILSFLMCFGGGVFFGTFLLHMLPEVNDIMDKALLEPKAIEYPVTNILIGAGFFLVLLADQLVSSVREFQMKRKLVKASLKHSEEGEKDSNNCITNISNNNDSIRNNNIVGTVLECCERKYSHIGNNPELVRNQSPLVGVASMTVLNIPVRNPNNQEFVGQENGKTSSSLRQKQDKTCFESKSDCKPFSLDMPVNSSQHCHNKDDQNHHHHQQQENQHHNHNTRSIVLVLALSLHHIFEGLSIGLQTNISNVWHLTLAVLCHETAICFSMGLQFYKVDRRLTKKVLIILVTAAIVMPVGIFIGLAISEAGEQNHEPGRSWQDLLNGILQSLACGTFIYVTFFEILFEELSEGHSSILKIFCMILGFGFMALLGLVPESDDGLLLPDNVTTVAVSTATAAMRTGVAKA